MKKVRVAIALLFLFFVTAPGASAADFKAIQLISGTYTATTNGSSKDTTTGTEKIGTNVPAGREGTIYLNVGGPVSGSSPTLDVTVQDSPDGLTWYTHIAITQATATTTAVKRYGTDFYSFGRYVRARCVIGGTTPSFVFFVDMNIRR